MGKGEGGRGRGKALFQVTPYTGTKARANLAAVVVGSATWRPFPLLFFQCVFGENISHVAESTRLKTIFTIAYFDAGHRSVLAKELLYFGCTGQFGGREGEREKEKGEVPEGHSFL